MNLYEKLLDMQKQIDQFVKDNTVGEGRQTYKAVGSDQVLEKVRPMMNELGLLLFPSVVGANVITGQTGSGTTRYFTELTMNMTWHDVESGEELIVPWYGQGVDLAGEKGVGKANTYAEKYFFMKFFHVPTPKDDPDADRRTQRGELRQRGTQADRENLLMYRKAIPQMLSELYGDDTEKIEAAYIFITKNEKGGYAGVKQLTDIKDAALPVAYGKLKKQFEKKTGRVFTFREDDE